MNKSNEITLKKWHEAKTALEAAKVKETQLRGEVIAAFFPVNKIGSNTFERPGKFKLKLQRSLKYSFYSDKEAGFTESDSVQYLLDSAKTEKDQFIFQRLIDWSPELVVSEYRKLEDSYRDIVDKYIITKENSPQLKLDIVGSK